MFSGFLYYVVSSLLIVFFLNYQLNRRLEWLSTYCSVLLRWLNSIWVCSKLQLLYSQPVGLCIILPGVLYTILTIQWQDKFEFKRLTFHTLYVFMLNVCFVFSRWIIGIIWVVQFVRPILWVGSWICVTVLCLYLGQCSVLLVSLSCPAHFHLHFKLFIIGQIKMDGWMDNEQQGTNSASCIHCYLSLPPWFITLTVASSTVTLCWLLLTIMDCT